MKCPHCGVETTIPDYAYVNVTTYHKPVNVATDCCQKPIRLSTWISVKVTPLKIEESGEEDSWGTPYNLDN